LKELSSPGTFFILLNVDSQIGLEPLCQFAAGEQDSPPAAAAFEADIRSKAGNGPFVGAAWMLFAKAQMVI
jgi:hypothetical protein